MENEEQKTIEISAELYRQLREYCDSVGIRFKDFIEESLELASYYDERQNILVESEKALKKLSYHRDRAYIRGFQQGLLAAFCAAQGNLGTNLHNKTLERIEKYQVSKCVEGPQLQLFK